LHLHSKKIYTKQTQAQIDANIQFVSMQIHCHE